MGCGSCGACVRLMNFVRMCVMDCFSTGLAQIVLIDSPLHCSLHCRNALNQDGRTALTHAAAGGHADCVRLLLALGADKEVECRVHCGVWIVLAI
jgi:hypothetical protein